MCHDNHCLRIFQSVLGLTLSYPLMSGAFFDLSSTCHLILEVFFLVWRDSGVVVSLMPPMLFLQKCLCFLWKTPYFAVPRIHLRLRSTYLHVSAIPPNEFGTVHCLSVCFAASRTFKCSIKYAYVYVEQNLVVVRPDTLYPTIAKLVLSVRRTTIAGNIRLYQYLAYVSY